MPAIRYSIAGLDLDGSLLGSPRPDGRSRIHVWLPDEPERALVLSALGRPDYDKAGFCTYAAQGLAPGCWMPTGGTVTRRPVDLTVLGEE